MNLTSKHQKLFNAVNLVLDWGILTLAYLLSIYLRQTVLGGVGQLVLWGGRYHYAETALGYATGMVILFAALRLYGSYRFRSFGREAFTLFVANGIGVLALGTGLYLLKWGDFARTQLGFFYAFSMAGLLAKRVVLRALLRYVRARGRNTRSVLLVGSGPLAQRYHTEITARPWLGYVYLGYLSDEQAEGEAGQALGRWRGTLSEFRHILQTEKVEEVVVALPAQNADLIGGLVAAAGRYGAKISIIPTYNDFIPAAPTVENIAGLKLLNVRRAPGRGAVWATAKRCFDVVASAAALVLLSPVMLAAAIAVRVSSPGPIIFKQRRCGLQGKEFDMYKFRSMYKDAEQRLAELEQFNESDGPTFKIANDPRITPVGHFLRRTSIDELPQLFNILKGDMSIVGPRPPLPREVAQYNDWEWGRLAVRPGLTCYWQVSGRSNLSFDEWMTLDLKYIEEQGPLTDLSILLKTVGAVIRGDGAY